MSKVKMMGMKPDDDEITTKNIKNHIIGRRLKNCQNPAVVGDQKEILCV